MATVWCVQVQVQVQGEGAGETAVAAESRRTVALVDEEGASTEQRVLAEVDGEPLAHLWAGAGAEAEAEAGAGAGAGATELEWQALQNPLDTATALVGVNAGLSDYDSSSDSEGEDGRQQAVWDREVELAAVETTIGYVLAYFRDQNE